MHCEIRINLLWVMFLDRYVVVVDAKFVHLKAMTFTRRGQGDANHTSSSNQKNNDNHFQMIPAWAISTILTITFRCHCKHSWLLNKTSANTKLAKQNTEHDKMNNKQGKTRITHSFMCNLWNSCSDKRHLPKLSLLASKIQMHYLRGLGNPVLQNCTEMWTH